MKYGFLYKEYHHNIYYWEVIKIYLKLLIILVLVYYS